MEYRLLGDMLPTERLPMAMPQDISHGFNRRPPNASPNLNDLAFYN